MARNTARDLEKESAWRRRLERQAASGQSVRAWCREHRVTETAFYWWRRELIRRDAEDQVSTRRAVACASSDKLSARRDAEQAEVGAAGAAHRVVKTKPASFVPVHVAEDRPEGGHWRIEIMLTDGRCIRVTGPVDRQALADVLDVLTSSRSVDPERRAC